MAILRTPEAVSDVCRNVERWAEVKRLAEVHRFSGQLAYVASPFLPAPERSWRDQVLMTHHKRHAQRLDALGRLVEAFRQNSIDVLSLKGPLLAERFYATPFLRPANDLDLLVREADIGRAARLMLRLGFTVEGAFPWKTHRRWSHHLEFRGMKNFPEVEVHFVIQAGRSRFQSERFFERSVVWNSAAGFETRVLSPADEAFHSAVHAASHAFRRLRWVYDFLSITRSLTEEERVEVSATALDSGETGPFAAICMAAREFFDESPQVDCRAFPLPWLWSRLTRDQLRRMVTRVEGGGNPLLTTAISERINGRIDMGRLAGSPAKAAAIASFALRRAIYVRWHRLFRPGDPETLARTLLD